MTTNLYGSRTERFQMMGRMLRSRNSPEARREAARQTRNEVFGRMLPDVRRIMEASEDVALELGADLMDTGHLLAGLLSVVTIDGLKVEEVRPRLARGFSPDDEEALATLGISLSDVIENAQASFGSDAMRSRRPRRGQIYRIQPSFEWMMALGIAEMEARVRGASDILPAHLLMALLEPGPVITTSRALAILHASGCDIAAIRRSLESEIGPRPLLRRSGQRAYFEGTGIMGMLFRWMSKDMEQDGMTEHRIDV